MNTLITTILQVSNRIKNNRTQYSVFGSVVSEVGELSEEINVANGLSYKQAGPDGVIGEAIDSIISLVDLIYVYAKENNIELTEENLIRIAEEKLAKWERWELAKSN